MSNRGEAGSQTQPDNSQGPTKALFFLEEVAGPHHTGVCKHSLWPHPREWARKVETPPLFLKRSKMRLAQSSCPAGMTMTVQSQCLPQRIIFPILPWPHLG